MKPMLKKMVIAMILSGFAMSFTGCSMLKSMFVDKRAIARKKAREKRKAEDEARKKMQIAAYESLKKEGCENIKERVKKASRYKGGLAKGAEVVGYRAAKCGHWDYIFIKSTRYSAIATKKIFNRLEAKGIDIFSAYGPWLEKQKQPYNFSYGNYAVINIEHWLERTHLGKNKNCKALLTASKKAEESYGGRTAASQNFHHLIRGRLIYYMSTAKCGSMLGDYLTTRLENSRWRDRSQACIILGEMKYKKSLKQVRSLAKTDGHSYLRYRKQVFPVRDSCLEAYGKIKRSM